MNKNEFLKDTFNPKIEAESRLKRLESVICTFDTRLDENERQKIKAIIVFGSTARGAVMHPDADIDIHLDLDPYDDNLFNKIVKIFIEQMSGTDLNFTSKNIIKGGRMARLITNQKYPDIPSQWKFIYSRNDQEKSELDLILLERQKQNK